mmetsp:Transcript_37471/g.74314  ORF Transcript_37471/g.74314 Transcript_37471/m.74314 type:complete len:90 (-) Transcript_37471:641-910(-)
MTINTKVKAAEMCPAAMSWQKQNMSNPGPEEHQLTVPAQLKNELLARHRTSHLIVRRERIPSERPLREHVFQTIMMQPQRVIILEFIDR